MRVANGEHKGIIMELSPVDHHGVGRIINLNWSVELFEVLYQVKAKFVERLNRLENFLRSVCRWRVPVDEEELGSEPKVLEDELANEGLSPAAM